LNKKCFGGRGSFYISFKLFVLQLLQDSMLRFVLHFGFRHLLLTVCIRWCSNIKIDFNHCLSISHNISALNEKQVWIPLAALLSSWLVHFNWYCICSMDYSMPILLNILALKPLPNLSRHGSCHRCTVDAALCSKCCRLHCDDLWTCGLTIFSIHCSMNIERG